MDRFGVGDFSWEAGLALMKAAQFILTTLRNLGGGLADEIGCGPIVR
jgi:hypothetical protein